MRKIAFHLNSLEQGGAERVVTTLANRFAADGYQVYIATEWTAENEFTIDSQKEYKSAKIWVTLGGPNVWIDTAERAVKLAWGTDREEYPLDWDVCNEIDNIMQDIYEC